MEYSVPFSITNSHLHRIPSFHKAVQTTNLQPPNSKLQSETFDVFLSYYKRVRDAFCVRRVVVVVVVDFQRLVAAPWIQI